MNPPRPPAPVARAALALAVAACIALAQRASVAQSAAPAPSSAEAIAGTRPACVAVSKASVFNGVGYNHLVTIDNRCAARTQCTVTSSVSPERHSVGVDPGRSVVVNTYLGSPASAFVATVTCAP